MPVSDTKTDTKTDAGKADAGKAGARNPAQDAIASTEATARDAAGSDQESGARRRGDYVMTGVEPIEDEDDRRASDRRVGQLRDEARELNTNLVDATARKVRADAEYAALQNQAQLKNAELLRLVGQPARKPTTIMEYTDQQARKGAKTVKVVIPRGFQHRLDDHQMIDVPAGVRTVPEELANHWWFAANGVVTG